MRVVLVSAVLGGLVGAAVAILVTVLQSSQPVPAMAAERPSLAPPVRVPLGWDKRFLGRLSGMESRLSALEHAKPEADRGDAGPPESPDSQGDISVLVAQRKAEIELQYQRDLDEQAQKLIEHQNER